MIPCDDTLGKLTAVCKSKVPRPQDIARQELSATIWNSGGGLAYQVTFGVYSDLKWGVSLTETGNTGALDGCI